MKPFGVVKWKPFKLEDLMVSKLNSYKFVRCGSYSFSPITTHFRQLWTLKFTYIRYRWYSITDTVSYCMNHTVWYSMRIYIRFETGWYSEWLKQVPGLNITFTQCDLSHYLNSALSRSISLLRNLLPTSWRRNFFRHKYELKKFDFFLSTYLVNNNSWLWRNNILFLLPTTSRT